MWMSNKSKKMIAFITTPRTNIITISNNNASISFNNIKSIHNLLFGSFYHFYSSSSSLLFIFSFIYFNIFNQFIVVIVQASQLNSSTSTNLFQRTNKNLDSNIQPPPSYLNTIDGYRKPLLPENVMSSFGSCTAPEVMVNGSPSPDIAGTVSGGEFGSIEEIQFVGMISDKNRIQTTDDSGQIIKQKRICKIKCLNGVWIGPLCAFQNAQEYEPILRPCRVPTIANGSIVIINQKRTYPTIRDLPHGSIIKIKCKEIGMFKLTSSSDTLQCIDGLWDNAQIPQCQPTTLHMNFSLLSPPSILYTLLDGTLGINDYDHQIVILPGAIVHLDCVFQETFGQPQWSVADIPGDSFQNKINPNTTDKKDLSSQHHRVFDYTEQQQRNHHSNSQYQQQTHHSSQSHHHRQRYHRKHHYHQQLESNQNIKTHTTGWAILTDKQSWKYRLAIYYATETDTGRYTCTTPNGLTNHIDIVVKDVQCPSLDEMGKQEDPNRLESKTGYRMHDRIRFSCLDGFRLSGRREVECLPTGQWSHPFPTCQEITCQEPELPLNGQIMVKSTNGRYLVGDYIQFGCRKGFKMIGQDIVTCLHTEQWSSPPPICKQVCSYPSKLLHGYYEPVKFHYDFGETILIHCDVGYFLAKEFDDGQEPSSSIMSCGSDGLWIGEAVKCKRFSPNKNNNKS